MQKRSMNKHVNSISGRLSLRPPQLQSLEILHRITEIVPLYKNPDIQAALEIIKSEYPAVSDFEREFPSLCYALATGVGKTRLMGAFISYLHLAHGINNFFVLAPNLTIYNKLITDFTENTPKYVFKGIAEFAVNAPAIITGDDYESQAGNLFDQVNRCRINIFNISKINSDVRGGKSSRIKRLSEYIGESYFDYLAGLDDLVLLMDESHRYRASAGVRAINELKPVLGLELTATPFVENSRGPIPFKNVVYNYPLRRAMEDGFVKEPAVVTRKDFSPLGKTPEQIETIKLEDGIRLHESVKVELETYARETGNRIVKPFVLVIARDTTHAAQLLNLIKADIFFEGRYKEKVIQVDSSQTGAAEEAMIQRLLAVETTEEPTEIVIHVNMLKEGWDVTNLYTIVPLRAANARTLIEQSIGRGLRLPFGRRTGVGAVDRLNIVAHDKFQEIIDEAGKPGSQIHLKQLIIEGEKLEHKTVTVVSQSNLASSLGIKPSNLTSGTQVPASQSDPVFKTSVEQKVAQIAYGVIRKLENEPEKVPTIYCLQKKDIQEQIVAEATLQYASSAQKEMEGITPDIGAIVAQTVAQVIQQMIEIPSIIVVPKGEVESGFKPFKLDLTSINYQPPSDELWVQMLRTGEREIIGLSGGGVDEGRLENYIVSGLIDFDDIAYDDHAELLYDLSGQVVEHLKGYLGEGETRKVLRYYQRDLSRFIHAQMQDHYWEGAVGYDVVVSKGFSELKPSAYTAQADNPPLDFRKSPKDKSNMAKYLFEGFQKCLYPVQKFDSDAERQLSVILERESAKWFKPARGQFQMFYKSGSEHLEYQPDFVAETENCIYMLEPKARNQMDDPIVLAKKESASSWCKQASDYAENHNGKPWKYVLIPHDSLSENMTLAGLERQFS